MAGKILLYFYGIQRISAHKLQDTIFEFEIENENSYTPPVLLTDDEKIIEGLLEINDSTLDLLAALHYLYDKFFINLKHVETSGSEIFHNIKVTAAGIDIIEGVERGEVEKNEFNVTFNIKVENNVSVDSLLKANLGSIFTGLGLNS